MTNEIKTIPAPVPAPVVAYEPDPCDICRMQERCWKLGEGCIKTRGTRY